MMQLNTFRPPSRRQKKRVGRGIGSGLGKTCGRGHKGQRSRSGARRDGNFEGGQMPLHRRVPKRGFNSRLAKITGHLRLDVVAATAAKFNGEEVNLSLLQKAGLLAKNKRRAKIYKGGDITDKITVRGLSATKGAIAAIESAGGKFDNGDKSRKTTAGKNSAANKATGDGKIGGKDSAIGKVVGQGGETVGQ